MRIESVNIGTARRMTNAKKVGRTGIYKQPVAEAATVTVDGLKGDAICDVKHHGGVDQAVYVYGAPDYAWWSSELGYDLEPGTFGENVTISDLESATLSIGDRLVCSEVVLEVTSPRVPCVTLARRMGDPQFVKRFRSAERPGLYCRVIREGQLRVGEAVTLEPYSGATIGVLELFRDEFVPRRDVETLRRFLAAPIAIRARVDKEQELQELVKSIHE